MKRRYCIPLFLILYLIITAACPSGDGPMPPRPSATGEEGPDWSAQIWDDSAGDEGSDDNYAAGAQATPGPGPRPMPANHTVDWTRRHAQKALSAGQDCASCHIEADCVSCHVESMARPYAVHPPNFTVIHASDARQGIQDCTSCHRLDTFCQACHVESRFSPRLEDSPPPALTLHPPGWLDAAVPENHGVMARRDINDCASCHVERDCVSCHRGISPHPPEFRFDCGRWLEANPAPCAQCHLDVAPLRDLCF